MNIRLTYILYLRNTVPTLFLLVHNRNTRTAQWIASYNFYHVTDSIQIAETSIEFFLLAARQ